MNSVPALGSPNSDVRFVQNNPTATLTVISYAHALAASLTAVPGLSDRTTIEQREALYAFIASMNAWQESMKTGGAA